MKRVLNPQYLNFEVAFEDFKVSALEQLKGGQPVLGKDRVFAPLMNDFDQVGSFKRSKDKETDISYTLRTKKREFERSDGLYDQ